MPNQKNITKVKDISEKLSKARSVYFTDYLGLSVKDLTELRRTFYKSDVEYLVVKNTLLKIASELNNLDLKSQLFNGSTAIAISYDEPVVAAKIIKDFLKNHDLPGVKGILFEGSFLDSSEFSKIASLPSKELSLTKLAIMLKSPVQNLANLLNSPMVKLLGLLNKIKENKN